jgi:hypothetical protein
LTVKGKIIVARFVPNLKIDFLTKNNSFAFNLQFVAAVQARRRQMMSALRGIATTLFGIDLKVRTVKENPPRTELEKFIGTTLSSTNPIDSLPSFLFPNNNRSLISQLFRSQIVASVGISHSFPIN